MSGRIGGLESSGWMAGLNRRLAADPGLQEALEASTQAYVAERDAIDRLGPANHPGGGPQRVKCLHAHAGHHLVTGDNPVGEAALAALEWTDPDRPCV